MEEIQRHIFLDEDKLGIGNSIYDFDFLKYLGGGNTCHYAKVRSKLNNKIYAMKIITNIDLNQYKHLEKKLYILKTLDHPNILKYYSSFIENDNYYIIMEYAENGSLKNYIKIHQILNKSIEENKINKMIFQSMSVLNFLKKEGYLHRNLSISNLFLSNDDNIKLGGFEYFCKNDDNEEKSIKPKEHIWLGKNSFSFNDDIYSLGLIFYNLKYLHPKEKLLPTKNKNNSRIFEPEQNNKKLKISGLCSLFFNNNQNPYDTVLKAYDKRYGKKINTSIASVYFSLIYLFQNHYIHYGDIVDNRKINIDKEFISKEPITQSLKFTNLTMIRNTLMEQNKSFSKYKETEIPPTELIKYLIKELHKENNIKNKYYSKIYVTDKNIEPINKENMSEENYNDLKRAATYSRFEDLFNQYFGSIISDKDKGLFGIYELQDICLKCKKTNFSFESFYYIILDLDAPEKSKKEVYFSIIEKGKFEIKTYKFCENCKNITEHYSIKSILKFPCRLVVLIKNHTKKKFIPQLIFKNKNYHLIGTINYNEENNSYKYSYFIINEDGDQKWEHPKNEDLGNNRINSKNLIAMFFLNIGEN